jgi:hypothetical protein
VLAHYIESSLRERINSICDPLLLLYSRNEFFSFSLLGLFFFFRVRLTAPAAVLLRRAHKSSRARSTRFLSIFFFSFCYNNNNNNIICCCSYIDSISSFILSADCCNSSSSSSSRVYRGVAILLAGRGHRNGE